MKYYELHCHSHFSWGDGVSSPKDIAERAKKLDYPYVAITDHGEITGWYEFYKACKDNEISPLFGIEFYTAYSINDTEENPFKPGTQRTRRGHLVVLAKGPEGIDALRELYNKSWTDYKEKGKKQIVFETDLMKYAGKIVVTSACAGSYIDSEEKVKRFKDTFGADFYIELQPHVIDHDFDLKIEDFVKIEDKQKPHNDKMYAWAKKYEVPIVITGDSHYPNREDKTLQDIIIQGNQFNQSGWHFWQDTHFLMNEATWKEEFLKQDNNKEYAQAVYEEGVHNLYDIAEKCKGIMMEQPAKLRKYDITTHPLYTEGDDTKKLIMKIIKDVGRLNKDTKYMERLRYELKIIEDKGFFDYFLIQEDIIRWNKSKGYLVGPARGSAAGSLLSYYLDITKIDPLKYDLLFERFLDIDRTDYPDIDVDYEMKEETVAYITQKYGAEYVMAIGAYQTMKIKTALKTAYRILYKGDSYNYQLVNMVTKEIPESNARGEGDQWEIFKELLLESKEEFEKCKADGTSIPIHNLFAFMKENKRLFKVIEKLLGKVTNMRVHPCSIVISERPVSDVLPVTPTAVGTSNEKLVTAFDGPAVEASGLVKFDVLGLKTLNCISACLEEVRKYKSNMIEGIDITNPNNIWKLEPNDADIMYKMSVGDTDTVFQFNTHPLKRLLRDMQASSFNDLVASAALIRPGPLKAGFPKLYCDRKFKKLGLHEIYVEETVTGAKRQTIKPAKYSHPLMDEILKDTYNVITYQEQVQKIFIKIGGFTPIESNKIRKAISKGKKSLLFDSKPQFIEYATIKLDPPWTAEQVDVFYEDMIGFGSYCFNLSHSVSYAFLGYVCQYLKTKYPLEWWSGNLKHAGEKGTATILKAIQKGNIVPIEPVDINQSKQDFYFNGTKIVMPLKHIDGVGDSGLDHMIKGQPFTSLKDFVDRMPGRSVRKNCVVNLIVADAFRNIETKTRPELIKEYLALKKEKEIPSEYQALIDDKAALEKHRCQVDPFYQSNWAGKYKHLFDGKVIPISKLNDFADGSKVYIGGEVDNIKYIKVKKGAKAGQDMAWVTVKQLNSSVKVTLWPDMVDQNRSLLETIGNGLLEVKGKITRYNSEVNLVALNLREVKIG